MAKPDFTYGDPQRGTGNTPGQFVPGNGIGHAYGRQPTFEPGVTRGHAPANAGYAPQPFTQAQLPGSIERQLMRAFGTTAVTPQQIAHWVGGSDARANSTLGHVFQNFQNTGNWFGAPQLTEAPAFHYSDYIRRLLGG